MPVSASSPSLPPEIENDLEELCADCYADPLGFVKACFPWGEDGPLKDETGPDTWQVEFMQSIAAQVKLRAFDGQAPVLPIRGAVSSGHGIGKSVMTAWLILWIMATRPDAQGSVTANTITQLDTKTWAQLRKWVKLCLVGHWFTINADRMYHNAYPASWFVSCQSSKEENSEAFAGQHAKSSTSFYIFDEASAIPEEIFRVAEGGLTDGEPMIFLFGNPTRTSGKFHEVCFGQGRGTWHPTIVDSRTSRFTNKALIEEWIKEHGEDSDFVRVRVRGLPPAASDLQFIDSARVFAAQQRPASVFPDDPLICGLDVARGGSDECVFRFRRGADARSVPAVRVPGEQARDSMRLVTLAADILGRNYDGRKVHALFVDATGGLGGAISDRLRQMGHRNVQDVQFGGEAPDPKMANMRAFMWSQMREWLARGAIDKTAQLEMDLIGPGYGHDRQDRLVLESKEKMRKRGVDSPDDGDALALTFAMPVRASRSAASNFRMPTGPDAWLGS